MSDKHSGSCLCGKVQFDVRGNFESFFLCHCMYCQKDTGSAHSANLFSTNAQLNWNAGEDNIRTYNLPSTRHTKSFCVECGSALPSIQMEGKLVVVPAGSLNSELSKKPDAHLFVSSKANWDENLEALKTFDTFPS